jgi:gentisate 1,2-dioxygenase
VHCLARGSTTRRCSTAPTQIVHALRGAVAVEVGPGGERFELVADDTLVVTGEAELALSATPGDAVAFVIELASPPRLAAPS